MKLVSLLIIFNCVNKLCSTAWCSCIESNFSRVYTSSILCNTFQQDVFLFPMYLYTRASAGRCPILIILSSIQALLDAFCGVQIQFGTQMFFNLYGF